MPMEEIAQAIAELSGNNSNEQTASPGPSPAPSPSSESASPAPAPLYERDATGRFAPRTAPQDQVPANQEQGQQGQEQPLKQEITPAPKPGPLKAPYSWTPEERQDWEKMLPHHQSATLRREAQLQETLNRTADARQFHQQAMEVIQPFMPMIQAEGSDPIRAMQNLFQTAAVLRTAPPMQKAKMVSDLILQHQVDLPMLNNILTAAIQGRPAPNDPMNSLLEHLDQRLAPVNQFMQTFSQRQQQAAQQVEQSAQQSLQEFLNDPANEFAMDVKDDMADLLELAANRGQTLSLSDAYKRATLAHPTISAIMQRRMLEQSASQRSAEAERASRASASVTDSGAPSQGTGTVEGDDVRSALVASIRQHSGRR